MTTAREDTTRLADLLRREHHALAEFLIALSAFDRDARWMELGYASLFDFLRRELKLSAGAAYYRKTAAELIQEFPEVIEPLRDGRLCFTSIVELAKNLTPENRDAVLPRFFHVSKREAKAITAELQPAAEPPMRTVVTAVPPPKVEAQPVPAFTSGPFHPDEVRAEVPPAPDALPIPPPRRRVEAEPLTAELRRIHLTSDRELLDLLAAARDALSHSHPGATDDVVIKVGLQLVIDRHRKRRGIGAKPRARKSATPTSPAPAPDAPAGAPSPIRFTERSRHVPADVARAVWARDRGCCAWKLEDGGVCASTSRIEFDHIDGWALGAGMTVDELRLLCRVHQDVHARALYGDDLMDRYTRPRGRGAPSRSRPTAPEHPPA